MIAFLHTSKVHIDRFEALVKKFNPSIETKHFVNKTLLDNALNNGHTDAALFSKEIAAIRKEAPSLVICTCSTYGAESDNHENVLRIDKPIIEYMVKNHFKIGLVYTANSTKTVSEDLLLETAETQQKPIEITLCDCSEYWPYFEAGNLEAYRKNIANTIRNIADKVDVIFLAQASMEGAKNYLTDLKVPIYTSPEFGIKTLIAQL